MRFHFREEFVAPILTMVQVYKGKKMALLTSLGALDDNNRS